MLDTDLAYAAAIIDGEGCIYVSAPGRKGTYRLNVSVAMTERRVVDFMATTFGGPVYDGNRTKREALGRRQIYTWRLVNGSAITFLEMIRPFLIGKTEQANAALSWPLGVRGVRLSPEDAQKRAELYSIISDLKK